MQIRFKTNPNDSDGYAVLGTSYLRLNQPDKAIGNLEKALELNQRIHIYICQRALRMLCLEILNKQKQILRNI